MQEFKRGARRSSRVRHAARLRFAASLLLIFSFTSGAARAQTGTPPVGGQDQRGIGLKPDAQQKPATPEEAKARGARPELVLQTGYAIIGASGMRFSPDGRLLATYSMSGGQVKLWDVSTGRELRTLAAGAGGAYFGLGGVRSVAFSCDGRLFAAGSTDGSTKVWDTATGRELHKLGGDDRGTGFDAVDAIAFGPDDRTLVALGGASAGGGESWRARWKGSCPPGARSTAGAAPPSRPTAVRSS